MSYDYNKLFHGAPQVKPTPVTRHATPVVPTHFTPGAVVPHGTGAYERLRHRAEANNAERLDARDGKAWRKSALTDQEKYYLWSSQGGKCANTSCGIRLDEKTMTIEHVIPKSKMPEGTWDIRNMTVLCHTCNARKNAGTMPTGMGYMPSIVPAAAMRAIGGRK
jgi:5-methylcytosine-specific restriction endonuclease McrA